MLIEICLEIEQLVFQICRRPEQIENNPARIPCIIVTQDAGKRLTNQLEVESGEINGLEVRISQAAHMT